MSSAQPNKLIVFWDKYLSKIANLFNRIHVIALTLAFVVCVYIAYSIIGETDLVSSPAHFVYFLVTTATTVGYGDMSPSTEQGMLFTAFIVMPISLSLFALIITKLASNAAQIWYRQLKGKHTLNTMKNHILILGYNRERTPHLVKMLKREEKSREIVLVSVEQQENPLQGLVQFINASAFTDKVELNRANIESASCIVVDTDKDDTTLTLALYVSKLNPSAHLVGHFIDEVKCEILSEHLPNAETISNLSTELLAKSVMDSGSSQVHSELVSAHEGQTQYSIKVPSTNRPFTLAEIFLSFKQDYEATIIGVRAQNDGVQLNVNLDSMLSPNDTIYYIADERIEFENWPK